MAENNPPTLYLLHGDDELAASEFVTRLRAKVGDPSAVVLNMHEFNADGLDLGALAQACRAAPFLARRRLVVVRPASALVADAGRQARLEALLGQLPPTTALVLIEPRPLAKTSPLLRWAGDHADSTLVREFAVPHGEAFVRWVRQRCLQLGGDIDPQAAFLLAELVGDDPRLADQELTKLLDYVDRLRPIGSEDVERLTPFGGQSNVFAMVDALGMQDGPTALNHLHRLLEDEPPQYALAMIARQFRLLLLAREAIETGQDPRQALRVHPFVAGKIAAQARRFTLPQLEDVLRGLLAMDTSIKTGQTDEKVALDAFIAGLTA
jgi:DNA polymerase III subunit delta